MSDELLLEERLRLAAGPLAGGDPPDLGAALESSGHADVVYQLEDSPVGRLLLAATQRGLVCVRYVAGEDDVQRSLELIAAKLTPRVVAAGGRLERPRRELDEFFNGQRREFALKLDWSLVRAGFTRAVLEATAAIPFGQTRTYKGVAGLAGNERAFRAAGTALGSNPLPIVIPCHRVLHADGGLGGYTGGLGVKRTLLAIEGVLPASMQDA